MDSAKKNIKKMGVQVLPQKMGVQVLPSKHLKKWESKFFGKVKVLGNRMTGRLSLIYCGA